MESRIILEVAGFAKNGQYKLLISTPEHHKKDQAKVWATITIAEILMELIQSGVILLIQRRDGNIVIQLHALRLIQVPMMDQVQKQASQLKSHSRIDQADKLRYSGLILVVKKDNTEFLMIIKNILNLLMLGIIGL